ncbi:MAG: ABC transporter substrate-binding protein [Calditrichia bacterium]
MPNAHEIIFSLGLGDHVIATSKYSSYPEATKNITKVGGLYDVNLEAVIRMKPSHVITDSSVAVRDKIDILQSYGINVISIKTESIEDIYTNIILLGEKFDAQKRAKFVVDSIKKSLDNPNLIPSFKKLKGLRGLIIVGREPGTIKNVYVAGRKTYLSQLMEKLGITNIIADDFYVQVNTEFLIRNKIDVLFEIRLNATPEQQQQIGSEWNEFFTAFKSEPKIVVLSGDYVTIPGPRIGYILREMVERIQ